MKIPKINMFEGLFTRDFYSKCKKAIKQTKTRIETVKRRKMAMQKYMKNDIADLIQTGLDIDAYGRVEEFLIELSRSSCYDLIEQFCECVSDHLSLLRTQRQCPEDCKEAISSLMLAASRFGDLPELYGLKVKFTERYGNSLETYVNHELIKKSNPMPPTKDMKIQLMENIAKEGGLEWDSKALEQKLFSPPASEQDKSKDTNDHEIRSQTGDNVTEGKNQEKPLTKSNGTDKPKLRSVKKRLPKPPPDERQQEDAKRGLKISSRNNVVDLEGEYEKALDRLLLHYSTQQDDAKRSLKISSRNTVVDQEDEYEKALDRLLLHYSTQQDDAKHSLKISSRNNVVDEKGEYEKALDRLLLHYSTN